MNNKKQDISHISHTSQKYHETIFLRVHGLLEALCINPEYVVPMVQFEKVHLQFNSFAMFIQETSSL